MKKLIILVILILLVFASCGGDKENPIPKDMEETPVRNFEYKSIAGGIEIIKYTGLSMRVRIPEKIDGKSVASIGAGAFENSGIMEIYIPNKITKIGDRAFAGNIVLYSVTIPKSVTSIGNGVFRGCTDLKSLKINSKTSVGSIILFNGDIWRVLEIKDGKALIISEDVLFTRPYNFSKINITWEDCGLRDYLNGEFYNNFAEDNKIRIIENDFKDKIFLLSIEEAEKYFASESLRAAYNADGMAWWWWLRSPGESGSDAARVFGDGYINLTGGSVDFDMGGVRPAMWVELD